jgi:uncharacterized membrane protein
MTAPHADQLIDGYLARLTVAAMDLSPSVRVELIADVRAHIAEARDREPEETDATILNILDRLGDPELLVVEARQRPTPVSSKQSSAWPGLYQSGILEIGALVLLPFVWVIGIILLWLSPAWKTRDKVIGSVFSLGGYPGIFIIGGAFGHRIISVTTGGNSCTSSTDSAGNVTQACTSMLAWEVIGLILSVALAVIVWLLPVITSVYLALRLRAGRRAQGAMVLTKAEST